MAAVSGVAVNGRVAAARRVTPRRVAEHVRLVVRDQRVGGLPAYGDGGGGAHRREGELVLLAVLPGQRRGQPLGRPVEAVRGQWRARAGAAPPLQHAAHAGRARQHRRPQHGQPRQPLAEGSSAQRRGRDGPQHGAEAGQQPREREETGGRLGKLGRFLVHVDVDGVDAFRLYDGAERASGDPVLPTGRATRPAPVHRSPPRVPRPVRGRILAPEPRR
ncbi:hypothetical protein [Streptomyces sp. NBC_01187]|uniref:hypothetical protein n=1 Tax=Streptomyces sp. NBC_01187 TaxID=2903766 RepID=UPI0038687D78|nr:hypothetical protein OG220_25415 [Streptomyces sp. NBC_01187]